MTCPRCERGALVAAIREGVALDRLVAHAWTAGLEDGAAAIVFEDRSASR